MSWYRGDDPPLDAHLSLAALDRFAQGTLPSPQAGRVVAHLLSGCRRCAERLEALLEISEGVEAIAGGMEAGLDAHPEYDAAVDGAFARVMAQLPEIERERRRGERALPLLRELGAAGLRHDPRLQGLSGIPLVETLLKVSFERRFEDPAQMLELAELARDFAGGLDGGRHGVARVADLRARASAELGNAYRIAERLPEAREAFGMAERFRQDGSGDPLLAALVDTCRAALHTTLRQFPEARELYDRTIAAYEQIGDAHAAGRTRVQRAICSYYEGDAQRALAEARRGYALLDPAREPEVLNAAGQSLLEILAHCGEYGQAARLLLQSGLRQKIAEQPINRMKLRWTEGRILVGLGRRERAEEAFREARDGFLDLDHRYHAAVVGLDLAAVWLELGRDAEVGRLASDTLAAFREFGIHREAQQALSFLNRACEKQKVTPSLLRLVIHFLDRLEKNPHLSFVAPT
jgi:tetratricopeptide (TPR) repeat protein